MTELSILQSSPTPLERPRFRRSTSYKSAATSSSSKAGRPQLARTSSCRSAARAMSSMPELERSSSFRCSPKGDGRRPMFRPPRSPNASFSSSSSQRSFNGLGSNGGGGMLLGVGNNQIQELEFPDSKKWAKVQLSDDDDDESDSDIEDISAHDLISAAKGRVQQQKLMDELKAARQTIQRKDIEIKQLKGQLNLAISTKRDLAQANQDLEIQHEVDLQELSIREDKVKRCSNRNLEIRAQVEKEFMNEVVRLAEKAENIHRCRIRDLQKKDEVINRLKQKLHRMDELVKLAQRVEESEERLLRECDEKDETIRRLQEKISCLEHQQHQTSTD